MNLARASAASGNDELWERLISARKNPFKQAALFGYSTLFLMLTRRLSIHDAAPRSDSFVEEALHNFSLSERSTLKYFEEHLGRRRIDGNRS